MAAASARNFLSNVPESWLLLKKEIVGHPDFPQKMTVHGWQLYANPELTISSASRGGVFAVILGEAIDLENTHRNESQIAEHLLNVGRLKAPPRERALSMARATHWLSGRFVLLVFFPGTAFCVLDAVGLRTVCSSHPLRQAALASHPRLLAELFGLEPDDKMRDFASSPQFNAGGRYFPGSRSLYGGVQYVFPNQLFSLTDSSHFRFFPLTEREEQTVEGVTTRTAPALQTAYNSRFITSRYGRGVVRSLSGGLDSRLALALARASAPKSLFFTYGGGQSSTPTSQLPANWLGCWT